VRGALRRGNQGGRIMASTRRPQGAELGTGAVGGGWIRWWRGWAQVIWEEGDMGGGANLSARCGMGQRRLEVGALSYDGGGNQAGHRRSTRACWTG
jgi:hypothetical protein